MGTDNEGLSMENAVLYMSFPFRWMPEMLLSLRIGRNAYPGTSTLSYVDEEKMIGKMNVEDRE